MTRNQQIRWLVKPAVFLASVVPSAWLVWAALHGQLSVNPLADLTNETGVWTLRFLALTLCLTPVRRLAGWNDAIRLRRMLGLFAFYYGSLHLLTYVVADRLAGLELQDGILVWTTASVDTSKPTICGRSKPTISWRPRLGSFTSARPRCASRSAPWCASFEAHT